MTSRIDIRTLIKFTGVYLTGGMFQSIGIVQARGQGLGTLRVVVGSGPDTCPEFFQIPALNECFIVTESQPFTQFELRN